MILVDSSVWIDHFRSTSGELVLMLSQGRVIQHPFVTAEIALGNIKDRDEVIALLTMLPQKAPLQDAALLDFVTSFRIFGTGLGMVDAHLLGSVASDDGCKLWTHDKRLAAKAGELGLLFLP